MKPTHGRIVEYPTAAGTTRAATIVRVFDPDSDTVNLCVHTDFSNDVRDAELASGATAGQVWRTSVTRAETPTPGKWNWPARV
jgi:hypothetical protein